MAAGAHFGAKGSQKATMMLCSKTGNCAGISGVKGGKFSMVKAMQMAGGMCSPPITFYLIIIFKAKFKFFLKKMAVLDICSVVNPLHTFPLLLFSHTVLPQAAQTTEYSTNLVSPYY